MKIRSRRFDGRCSKHKRYNPAIDGPLAVSTQCARCQLLWEIWETSLKINELIRRFDPKHDDLRRPAKEQAIGTDPRQMSLI